MDIHWRSDTSEWAEAMFRGSQLGDSRLVSRLIRYAERQAADPTASTAKACGASKAEREGAYRLLENARVTPRGIDEGPYAQCKAACQDAGPVLLVQDTTSVKVHHQALADLLREEGCPTGFLAHTTLAVCGRSGMPLGLADQERWLRDKGRARRDSRKERDYEAKESARWERALDRARERLDGVHALISVADREADIFEFLAYHVENGLDFVIRASWNRRVSQEVGHVFEAVRQAPVLGHRSIQIEQRGAQRARAGQSARDARTRRAAQLQLQATSVTVLPPQSRAEGLQPMALHAVRVFEPEPLEGTEPLEWVLLTSLPVVTAADLNQVVDFYEHRWRIEEFHKGWKTGCRLETRPLQSLGAVERMMAVTAAIALRILQLQFAAQREDAERLPAPLDDDEWKCLWASTSKEPCPSKKPSARWAYRALATLGGWYDSKRTGRAGWKTLWDGWTLLQHRLAGWRLARSQHAM